MPSSSAAHFCQSINNVKICFVPRGCGHINVCKAVVGITFVLFGEVVFYLPMSWCWGFDQVGPLCWYESKH